LVNRGTHTSKKNITIRRDGRGVAVILKGAAIPEKGHPKQWGLEKEKLCLLRLGSKGGKVEIKRKTSIVDACPKRKCAEKGEGAGGSKKR